MGQPPSERKAVLQSSQSTPSSRKLRSKSIPLKQTRIATAAAVSRQPRQTEANIRTMRAAPHPCQSGTAQYKASRPNQDAASPGTMYQPR